MIFALIVRQSKESPWALDLECHSVNEANQYKRSLVKEFGEKNVKLLNCSSAEALQAALSFYGIN